MAERGYVARSGSGATVTTPVALVAATAKTVVGVLGSSGDTISVIEIGISFDGVTPTAVPAVVELVELSTLGTSTSFTPIQSYGPAQATSCTAAYNCSVEPTVQNVRHAWYVPVFNGLWVRQSPLGREAAVVASRGFGLRVTAPAVVNCIPYIEYSE